MKKRFARLQALVGTAVVVRVRRKALDKHPLDGFVVDVSKKFLLLQVIEGNNLHPCGYAVVRLKDISGFRRDETFVSQALRLNETAPIRPEGIELADWRSLMISVQDRYTMLSIELEEKEPGCSFIGRVAKLTTGHVALAKVDPQARQSGIEKFAFKHITRLEFGNGYINSLALVSDYYDSGSGDTP